MAKNIRKVRFYRGGLLQDHTSPGEKRLLFKIKEVFSVRLNVCDREQGEAIGRALVGAGYVECVGEQGFVDGLAPYRLTGSEGSSSESPSRPPESSDALHQGENKSGDDLSESHNSSQEGQEPTWVKDLPHRNLDSTTTTGNGIRYTRNFRVFYTSFVKPSESISCEATNKALYRT